MRQIYKLLLALVATITSALPSLAFDFSAKNSDGVTIYYNILSETDKTVEVTFPRNYKYSGTVAIPEHVTRNGSTYTITGIGNSAFSGCTGLTSITIPNSVTSIGNNAFYGCYGLTSITIPNSVTSIGNQAFSRCSGLTSITIPNSVTSIGSWAFSGCSGLTSITIPNSVTSIGDYVFYECSGLTSITIPNSVTSIGSGAFSECSGLTSITIPNSVTSIGDYAFYGCSGLTSVTIPNSVTSIGDYVFYECSGLTSISIPNSVKSIGEDAFYGCSGLTSITIPNSVTSIGSRAFWGCSGLNSVTIDCMGIFGTDIFSGCDNLTSASFGSSVTAISDNIFYGCASLTSILIPNTVTSIGKNAFFFCTGLTSITIPNSVTSIGNSAFENCSGLNSVTCGNSVSDIGTDAFKGCEKLLKYEAINVKCCSLKVKRTSNGIGGAAQACIKDDGNNPNDEVTFTGLTPHSHNKISYGVKINGQYFEFGNIIAYTNDISVSLNHVSTATTVTLKYACDAKDATLDKILVGGTEVTNLQGEVTITGLEPESEQNYYCTLCVKEGNYAKYAYTEVMTPKLTFTTQPARVVNPGEVIVCAESNLSDAERNIGFQWRKVDAPETVPSKEGTAVSYSGTMEGYIKGLSTSDFYNYRPYYEASNGERTYGDWMGFDPSDFSYFEPTLHTSAPSLITHSSATLQGIAIPGSDGIAEQGFEYWPTSQSQARQRVEGATGNGRQTVTATGLFMSATVSGLQAETDYIYRSYIKTSNGNAIYGEEMPFSTTTDPQAGIWSIPADSDVDATVTVEGYYDINGRRHNEPQHGFNIVRYSDGSTRKLMVR